MEFNDEYLGESYKSCKYVVANSFNVVVHVLLQL